MPLTVACPHCRRSASVPDKYVGHNVRCPGCGQKFAVSGPEQQAFEEVAYAAVDEPAGAYGMAREPQYGETPLHRQRQLAVYGGAGAFALLLVSALLGALAAGFAGNTFGKALQILAGLCVVVDFGLSVAAFLAALRYVFAARDWVSVASLTGACVSFIGSSLFGVAVLASISAAILGSRVESVIPRHGQGMPPGFEDRFKQLP